MEALRRPQHHRRVAHFNGAPGFADGVIGVEQAEHEAKFGPRRCYTSRTGRNHVLMSMDT